MDYDYNAVCEYLIAAGKKCDFGTEMDEWAGHWVRLGEMWNTVEYRKDTSEEFRKVWQKEVLECYRYIQDNFKTLTISEQVTKTSSYLVHVEDIETYPEGEVTEFSID